MMAVHFAFTVSQRVARFGCINKTLQKLLG